MKCTTFKPSASPQTGPNCPALTAPSGHSLPHRPHWMVSTQSERLPLLLWLQPLQADPGSNFSPVQFHILNCAQNTSTETCCNPDGEHTGNSPSCFDGKPASLHSPIVPTARPSPGPPALPFQMAPVLLLFSVHYPHSSPCSVFRLFLPMYRHSACQHYMFLK